MLRVWARFLAIVAACVALASVSALSFSILRGDEYSASASVRFLDVGTARSPSSVFLPERNLYFDEGVNTRTAERLNDSLEPAAVARKVDVKAEGDVVVITATDGRPRQAAAIANAFANEYVAFRRTRIALQIDVSEGRLERQLEMLEPTDAASRRPLRTALMGLALARESLGPRNPQIARAAEVPTLPSSPPAERDAVVGAILGALVGVGVAVLVGRRRTLERDGAGEARRPAFHAAGARLLARVGRRIQGRTKST